MLSIWSGPEFCHLVMGSRINSGEIKKVSFSNGMKKHAFW